MPWWKISGVVTRKKHFQLRGAGLLFVHAPFDMYVVKHGKLETNYRDIFKLIQTASFRCNRCTSYFPITVFVLLKIKRKSHMNKDSGRICNFALRISNYFVTKKDNLYFLHYFKWYRDTVYANWCLFYSIVSGSSD